jgi:DNA-binding NarL/FixJ family response regulator
VKARTVRVVLVDDQESFRSAARLVIDMSEGFELVGEAETAEEGLEMAAELSPDLVLMDINLPGIDGLEATRRLVAGQNGTRVIVLSTYEASEYEARSLEAGAVAFISKSEFDPDTLCRVWDESPCG